MSRLSFLSSVILSVLVISCQTGPGTANGTEPAQLAQVKVPDPMEGYVAVSQQTGVPKRIWSAVAIRLRKEPTLKIYWDLKVYEPDPDARQFGDTVSVDPTTYFKVVRDILGLSSDRILTVMDQSAANMKVTARLVHTLTAPVNGAILIVLDDYTVTYILQDLPSSVLLGQDTYHLQIVTEIHGPHKGMSKRIRMEWE